MRVPLLGLLLVQVAIKSFKGDAQEALADSVSYQSDIDRVKALNARLSDDVKAFNARLSALESRKAEAMLDTKKRLSQEPSLSSLKTDIETLKTDLQTIRRKANKCATGSFLARASDIPDARYASHGFTYIKTINLSAYGFHTNPHVTVAIQAFQPKSKKQPSQTFNNREHLNDETEIYQRVEAHVRPGETRSSAADIYVYADDAKKSVTVSWIACGGLFIDFYG